MQSLLRSRTEQRKPGEDFLQVRHLTRYELGDGESDNLGRTVDVGDHAARFRRGEATAIGAQTQLDLIGSVQSCMPTSATDRRWTWPAVSGRAPGRRDR
jgi:hypothetical protein